MSDVSKIASARGNSLKSAETLVCAASEAMGGKTKQDTPKNVNIKLTCSMLRNDEDSSKAEQSGIENAAFMQGGLRGKTNVPR